MDKRKISAACATAAALAALCVPGSAAFAADGTLTLNAGDGSTSPDTASPCTRSLDTTTSSRTART